MDKRALQFINDTAKEKYSYNFEWLGRPIIQFPQDMIGIQEVIWRVKPDYVIETGVAHGGGLIFYASILEAMGHGEVIGIDIDIRAHNLEAIAKHRMSKRITLYEGSSTNPELFKRVSKKVGKKSTVMVILDSNHTHAHVYDELLMYSDLVSKGSYLIVLDTIIQFMPPGSFPDRPWDYNDNPWTAVQFFLGQTDLFEVDEKLEKELMITTAPGGYLRRIDK
jgi:cephalosporin hydroxylase